MTVLSTDASYDLDRIRGAVRQALVLADEPLRSLIRPGQTVCLKPNWIAAHREGRREEWEQIITHPTILKAVVGEVASILQHGEIVIADAPQTDSDIGLIKTRAGVNDLASWMAGEFPDTRLTVVDLRQEHWVQEGNITVRREKLPGDPRGAVLIDLGADSEFEDHSNNRQYYGADYDFADTRSHHSGGKHEYLISRSVLEADVFINLPKLKTHKKSGVTISLKNLVGINADKNYLPHYSLGAPSQGGDEFPQASPKRQLETTLSRSFKKLITHAGGRAPLWGPIVRRLGLKVFGPGTKVVRSGNWWGNDTLWRMCLDLNKILLWRDGNGALRTEPRPYLSIVDGVIAGEGDGPVDADPATLGLIIVGTDPVAVDLVCTRAIGLDWRRVPVIKNALEMTRMPITRARPEEVVISTNSDQADIVGVDNLQPFARFRPHFGWQGRIELQDEVMSV